MDHFETATRDSYDALAAGHVHLTATDLAVRPVDRALIGAFAGYVLATGNPRVADVGCGAGRVTPALCASGLVPEGIDLSPAMVARARREHPEPSFRVGSMLDLDVAGGALGGVLAWYSLIHVPPGRRPRALAEFRRVLTPGGALLLGFQVGDDVRHYDGVDGVPLDLDFHRLQPDEVAGLLAAAGFRVHARVVREPEPGTTEHTRQGMLLAVSPGGR